VVEDDWFTGKRLVQNARTGTIKNLSITALEAVNQRLQRDKVWVAGSSPAMENYSEKFALTSHPAARPQPSVMQSHPPNSSMSDPVTPAAAC
jgi:hypothetical protein